uniref:VHS domain-containing protein n=1 Tax=Cyanistes caeruleus TaxID=156563 RepID=A0A8C0ZEN0_CYACU
MLLCQVTATVIAASVAVSPSHHKATNPSNRQEDWEYIIGFCDQINKELEGWVSQTAVVLIN